VAARGECVQDRLDGHKEGSGEGSPMAARLERRRIVISADHMQMQVPTVCICVGVWVGMCVCERERERACERKIE
jgi:hypothetical protein